ncbi:MAG: RnfABCDGE type electron transport complex subunit D [Eubacteriales bacterium]|nr:RnfABCDGE type electron transport complex subunit D [Eubacteriales bacterium]
MNKLIVSSSPHIRGIKTTRSIMGDVLIALIPCVMAGMVYFGFRALLIVAVTTATAVLTEYLSRIIMKRTQTAFDLSAAVTGVILGLILPPGCGILFAVFGAVAAIAVVKQMFGGIGQNFANPACTARIILLISFSGMSVWTNTSFMTDAVTSATPLAAGSGAYHYFDLFIGNTGGCIGETSVVAILIGFIYLLVRKVISPIIPLAFIGGAAVMSLFCGQDMLFELMSGGLLFGAVFMATDYSTSPISKAGKVVFGIGCGVITMLIRVFGTLPEGVSFAILIMNIIAPQLDSLFVPKPFGTERRLAK